MNYLSHDEVQDELLEILKAFDRYARANDLRYSLDAGTLIGAVRHGGFIPWDDDIDVIMPRPDFERMIKRAHATPEGYQLSYVETNGSTFPFAKFENSHIGACEATYREKGRLLWVDIFPADGMSEDESLNIEAYRTIRELVERRRFQCYPSLNPLLNIIKKPMRIAMELKTPATSVARKMVSVAMRYPFEGSTWCRNLVYANNPDARLPTSDFENLISLEFCGHQFPAIPHWHEYLTSQYGDYMQLPPEEQRASHGLKAWRIEP